MRDNLISDYPVAISLLGLAGLFLFGFVLIGPVIGIFIAGAIYDVDVLAIMMSPETHPEASDMLLLSQGLASFIGLIALPLIYLVFINKKSPWPLYDFRGLAGLSNWLLIAFAVLALATALAPVVAWNASLDLSSWFGSFGEWAESTEKKAETLVTMLIENMSGAKLLACLVVVALLPAIGEELFFRGLVQREMVRAVGNPHIAILITAMMFSAVHLQFLGFFPRFFIGAFLGYLYLWSDNLIIPTIGHFLNNGIQLIAVYFYQQKVVDYDIDKPESVPITTALIGLVVLIVLLHFIRKSLQNSNSGVHS